MTLDGAYGANVLLEITFLVVVVGQASVTLAEVVLTLAAKLGLSSVGTPGTGSLGFFGTLGGSRSVVACPAAEFWRL